MLHGHQVVVPRANTVHSFVVNIEMLASTLHGTYSLIGIKQKAENNEVSCVIIFHTFTKVITRYSR
jgi:hypothetical protein